MISVPAGIKCRRLELDTSETRETPPEMGFALNGHVYDGDYLKVKLSSYPGALVARMFGYIIYSQGYVTEAEMLLGEEQAHGRKL